MGKSTYHGKKKTDDGTYVFECKYVCFTGQSMFGWKSGHNFL